MKVGLRVALLLRGCLAVALLFALMLSASTRVHSEAAGYGLDATIQIVVVPPKGGGPDRMETIAGRVRGVNFKQCRVVIFSLTNTWYVQPFVDSPYTTIDAKGNWETETHLGAEYAALVVKLSYKPPATTGTLPPVGGDVLAVTTATAKPQAERSGEAAGSEKARKVRFSGYDWYVKSSRSRVGPGPNYFSDNPDNVEVDAQGRLHLRITRSEGRWYCAEVVSERSFGYGTYRFFVDTTVDQLDPLVVLGLFTWSDASPFSHREIDIEVSRWGRADNKNGQFVVQPYTRPQNIVRFEIPSGLARSTHSFTWDTDKVFCQSLATSSADGAATRSVIYEHTFTNDVPQPGDENARINLWLLAGRPPSNAKNVEIIISKFEYAPLR